MVFPKTGVLQRDAVINWIRKKRKVPVEVGSHAVANILMTMPAFAAYGSVMPA
jgi:hypothetical protein